jgi:plastocyanin
MDRRSFLATLAAGASAGLAGCGVGGGNAPSAGYDVGMAASAFTPREVTVAVGDTVVWKNTNSRAHTVTAYEGRLPGGAAYFASGGFESEQAARDGFYGRFDGAISSDETYDHTFELAGAYPYFCIPHERGGMVGTVVVEG